MISWSFFGRAGSRTRLALSPTATRSYTCAASCIKVKPWLLNRFHTPPQSQLRRSFATNFPMLSTSTAFAEAALDPAFASAPAASAASAVSAVSAATSAADAASVVAANIAPAAVSASNANLQFLDDAIGLAVEHGLTVRSVGLGAYYTPAGWIECLVDMLHVHGLSWMGAIVAATVAFRIAALPLQWMAQAKSATFQTKQHEYVALRDRMTSEYTAPSTSRASLKKLGEEMKSLQKNGGTPQSMMKWVVLPLPIHLSLISAVRSISSQDTGLIGAKSESFFWLTDMTASDPTLALPLVASVMSLLGVELATYFGSRRAAVKPSRLLVYGLRLLPLAAFPIVNAMPAGMQCFILASGFVSLFQMTLIQHPWLRAKFNFPSDEELNASLAKMKEKTAELSGSGIAARWKSLSAMKDIPRTPPTLVEELYANNSRKPFVTLPKLNLSLPSNANFGKKSDTDPEVDENPNEDIEICGDTNGKAKKITHF